MGIGAIFRTQSRAQRAPCFRLTGSIGTRLSTLNGSVTTVPKFRGPAVSKTSVGQRTYGRSSWCSGAEEVKAPQPRWSRLQRRQYTRPSRIAYTGEDKTRIAAEVVVPSSSSFGNSSSPHPPTIEPVDVPKASPVDIMVIGSMAVELICTVPTVSRSSMLQRTSHPSKMHASAGGVAHNLALATSYSSSSSVRLITAVGSDPEGSWLREYVQNVGLDVAFISGDAETARQVAIYDKDGELAFASADMSIIEGFKGPDIEREIKRGNPKFVAFDGYVSSTSVKTILEECGPETQGTYQKWSAMLIPQCYSSLPQSQELVQYFKDRSNLAYFQTTPSI